MTKSRERQPQGFMAAIRGDETRLESIVSLDRQRAVWLSCPGLSHRDLENPMPNNLVSTNWLHENLRAPDIAVIDGSWYLPAQKRDGKAEHLARHIPGAVHFDIEEISDHGSSLPHMMPRLTGCLGLPSM